MDPSRLALVQGIDDTRRTLVAWNAAPWPVLARWLAGAAVVTALLLLGVLVVAASTTPDPTHLLLPGLNRPAGPGDVARVVARNLLVLTLHAMACVAGFIAGSSLPLQAEHHAGLWRRIHLAAGPAAIVFVVAATGFSLLTQAYVLGGDAAILAAQLRRLDPRAAAHAPAPRGPRAPRAVPAAGGVDHREPPRRLGGAPGRDVRDVRARAAGPRAGGERRGLRLAAPAAARVAGGLTRRGRIAGTATTLCIVLSRARPASPRSPCTTMAGTLSNVTDTSFQADVLESEQPVLVDFWAPWCGPCRVVAPVLEEIAGERQDLRIVKLNVDENQATAAKYEVLSIPTMILFKNGEVAKKVIGAYPKKRLEAELEPALA